MTIIDKVEDNFKKDISTEVILPNIKVLNSTSKQSPEFLDPKYIPFYYRLGKELNCKSAIQIGSKLGLVASSFLKGCKSVDYWCFFDETKPPINIIESNLKINGCYNCFFNFPIESTTDTKNLYDIAFLSQVYDSNKSLFYMKFLWEKIKPNSFLIVDYVFEKNTKEVFDDFCAIKNRIPRIIKTRYGVGIVTKQ
jgi:hypothetical protein